MDLEENHNDSNLNWDFSNKAEKESYAIIVDSFLQLLFHAYTQSFTDLDGIHHIAYSVHVGG